MAIPKVKTTGRQMVYPGGQRAYLDPVPNGEPNFPHKPAPITEEKQAEKKEKKK